MSNDWSTALTSSHMMRGERVGTWNVLRMLLLLTCPYRSLHEKSLYHDNVC